MKLTTLITLAAVAASASASLSHGATIATATVTGDHNGYYLLAGPAAANTKTTIGPFTGTARVIHVAGKFVNKQPANTWATSLQVVPRGNNLAVRQPSWQFSDVQTFGASLNVTGDILIPGGGLNLSQPITLENFSLDDEQYVPGVDATSSLTYTFDDAFAPGTVEWTGSLSGRDGTFTRPTQVPGRNGQNQLVWSTPFLVVGTPKYDVQTFSVDTAGSYTIASANDFYSAGVLYKNSFNPATPLVNIVAARDQGENVVRNKTLKDLGNTFNDDAEGGSSMTVSLLPGVQYYYLTTANDETWSGNYANVITGAGKVTLGTLVPEPTSLAALALGATALVRRRR